MNLNNHINYLIIHIMLLNLNQFHISLCKNESIKEIIKTTNILQLQSNISKLSLINFDKMPIILKEALILWLVEVNMKRINDGLPMIVTMELLRRFPFFRLLNSYIIEIDTSKSIIKQFNKKRK